MTPTYPKQKVNANRRLVPAGLAADIADAAAESRRWTTRLDELIADAFAAGASVREIADCSGLTPSMVYRRRQAGRYHRPDATEGAGA